MHSRDLHQAAEATIRSHGMIDSGSSIVVAMSGGPDSTALLHVLQRLAPRMDFRIVVAHLDHALRAESASDARFVREMAEDSGVPCFEKRTDVRLLAEEAGISVEEAGRRARYTFFDEVKRRCDAHVIATAHHADDSIETFFLRVLRGSTLTGLGGIAAIHGSIVRPFIEVSRREILAFLHANEIPYRQDPTNETDETDRNFVRNRLLPLISGRFPGFRGPVRRTIEMIRNEEGLLSAMEHELAAKALSQTSEGLVLHVPLLRAAPKIIAARVVRRALYRLCGPDVRWSRIHIDAVCGLLETKDPSARVSFPGRAEFVREHNRVRCCIDEALLFSSGYEIPVTAPGAVELPQVGVTIHFRMIDASEAGAPYPDGRTTAHYDADELPFPFLLRTVKPGDRFAPWGFQGSRKVKKVFMENRIPVRSRAVYPLLVHRGEIIWIPGIRRGRAAPVVAKTMRVLEVSLAGVLGSRVPHPHGGAEREKKVENLAHAVALPVMYYNFGRIHQKLRVTPAMEAGVSDRVWTLEEIAGLTDIGIKRGCDLKDLPYS